MIPDGTIVLHDAGQILYEHNVTDKFLQEDCIKRYMDEESVAKLEQILEHYKCNYTCDFKELQKQNRQDLKSDNFKLVE